MRTYFDPQDNTKKSSHLLQDCKQFLELQKYWTEMHGNAAANAYQQPMHQPMQQQHHQMSPPPQQQQPYHLPPPQQQQQQNLQIQNRAPEAFPPPCGNVPMINKANPSKREMKKFTREVNLAEACMATEYVDWSEQPIHFNQDDHPPSVPQPGHAALVVEAQIGGFNMGKILMDGGSGLNLLFANTAKVMGIPHEALAKTDTKFHGVIPTLPAEPLGKISLEVIFGKPGNFRKERLEFEVVDIESQYYAILGRPAFAKFMAVPPYTYLKMKMPGNNGTPLTVHGSFLRSDNCDRESIVCASTSGTKKSTRRRQP